jgi:GNAT superfamily N-acetyltransferase
VSTPPAGLVWRRARPDEARAIEAVVDAAYRHYIAIIGQKPGPMLVDYDAAIRDDLVWVTCEGPDIIGVLRVILESDHALLDNVAVLPRWRGRHLGRFMIDEAEREARRRGFTELRTYTHERMTTNVAMYPRLGYEETARRTEDGFPRVFFRKRLIA